MNQVLSGNIRVSNPSPFEMTRRLRLLCVADSSRRSERARLRARLLSRQLNAELKLLPMQRQNHKTIVEAARDWDADLIILGSQRTRFGDGFIGTTAERIIRRAHRPVLVVNRDVMGPYEHVLLTSDLSSVSAAAARVAQDLGLLDGGSASVVHSLGSASASMLRMSGVSEPSIETFIKQMSRVTSSEIREQLGNAGLRTDRLSVLPQRATPVRAIEQIAQLTDADLVVVGASHFPTLKRVVLGSISNEVLRRLTCDVLLVSPGAIKRARASAQVNVPDESELYDVVDRRLMDTFPASDAVARY